MKLISTLWENNRLGKFDYGEKRLGILIVGKDGLGSVSTNVYMYICFKSNHEKASYDLFLRCKMKSELMAKSRIDFVFGYMCMWEVVIDRWQYGVHASCCTRIGAFMQSQTVRLFVCPSIGFIRPSVSSSFRTFRLDSLLSLMPFLFLHSFLYFVLLKSFGDKRPILFHELFSTSSSMKKL